MPAFLTAPLLWKTCPLKRLGCPASEPPVFIYAFEKQGQKIVYAPCDIKPFPEQSPAVLNPDLLLIQPVCLSKD